MTCGYCGDELTNAELMAHVDRGCVKRLRAERDRLAAELAESNAACICGCPEDAHEDMGEDGYGCDGECRHDCLRASRAVAGIVGGLRAENTRLAAELAEAKRSRERCAAEHAARCADLQETTRGLSDCQRELAEVYKTVQAVGANLKRIDGDLKAEREAHAQTKAQLAEAIDPKRHCKDCCCARVWAALDLPAAERANGAHISQHVEALKARADRAEAAVKGLRMDLAVAEMRKSQAFLDLKQRADRAEAELAQTKADLLTITLAAREDMETRDKARAERDRAEAVLRGLRAWLEASIDATRREVAALQAKGCDAEAHELNQRITATVEVLAKLDELEREAP